MSGGAAAAFPNAKKKAKKEGELRRRHKGIICDWTKVRTADREAEEPFRVQTQIKFMARVNFETSFAG